MNTTATKIIGSPPKPKRIVEVLNGGAHRGAQQNLAAFRDFNREATTIDVVPVYVDPVPGRALALAEEARREGFHARAIEGRVEDVIESGDVDTNTPMVLNVDRASAIVSAMKSPRARGRTVLGYLLMRFPSGKLWGMRFVVEPKDVLARAAVVAFFERLGDVSERGGSRTVLADDPAHTLVEPAIRAWFAEHTRANLAKIIAGIEPATDPIEVTSSGHNAVSVHVVMRETWADPTVLAEEIVANPATPLRRGIEFVVAEVVPIGIRFHEVRRRTDGRVTLKSHEQLDRETLEARARENAARERAVTGTEAEAIESKKSIALELVPKVAAALLRADRTTLSRRNPIRTTD